MASVPNPPQSAGQTFPEPGQTMPLAEAYQIAVRAHQAGQLQQAASLYRQIVQADPTNAQVYYLLGAACQALGRYDEAGVQLQRSLELRPGAPETHNHLGLVRALQRDFAAAAACFEEAVRLRPNYEEARRNWARALQDQQSQQQTATAISFTSGVRSHEEWNNEGAALASQGKLEEALRCFREAIRQNADYAPAHTNLGNLLSQQGRREEALSSLHRAVQLRPEMFEVHFNLGNALRLSGRVEEALAAYQEAARLRPGDPPLLTNLAGAFLELGRLEEALATEFQVVQLQPNYAEGRNNLAVALVAAGRVAEALPHYDEAVRLRPDYAEARKNRSIAWLLLGDYERGWSEYQWRWQCRELTPPNYAQPRWDGTPLDGRTILLYAEQGLGDTLHFIRYVPLVHERGGRIALSCPRSLHRLLRHGLPIEQLLPPNETPAAFDVHAPLLGLPTLFGTTLATIPAQVPYLPTEEQVVERWRGELAGVASFKVGIAWQGSREHPGDRFRSVPLERFAPLAAVPGVRLVSLQKGPGTEQLSRWREATPIVDLGGRLEDWADTAGVVKNLDLVITVDSAVAHLAGAFGAPVWVALPFAPDWRWLLEREESPWYPTMRLFRQRQRGDWADVFARLTAALQRRLSAPS